MKNKEINYYYLTFEEEIDIVKEKDEWGGKYTPPFYCNITKRYYKIVDEVIGYNRREWNGIKLVDVRLHNRPIFDNLNEMLEYYILLEEYTICYKIKKIINNE